MSDINTIVLGMSTSVTSAISSQVSAQSTGLMHMNSAVHQQQNGILGISNTVMGIKKMHSGKLLKELAMLKKGL
ncbi:MULTISPECIES: RebB family R body protein [Chryseobacterium]|uniref:RebB family R body protein n=1 Tax=Chryseobacterium TaxID=59732 RepID=UPI001BE74B0B|nr:MULTISPECIES: RebB family R body protein [Chryseobacterium]MBT2620137.1 RebB family R body protein [Chryseobacterium sp. ISL-6]